MEQPILKSQPDTAAARLPEATPTPIKHERLMKPDHVPDKFWDLEQGIIRTDDLLKSYGELERHLGDKTVAIPPTPEDYEITMPSEQIQPDPDVNARLHAAGFTQEQTQLVYDLAHEKLSPLITETTAELHQNADVSRLEARFGGAVRWQEISRQLKTWGQANLPAETFNSLSSNVDGVIAIHRMMQSGEPSLIGNQMGTSGGRGEKDLKQMMRDPRYWRDQDPVFVEQVRKGFQALYPD